MSTSGSDVSSSAEMPSAKKSLADMRKELREMRKETVKPISRMKKGDIASEIQKLSGSRETTAPCASTPMAPAKAMKSAVESIKVAKASEFPVKPTEQKKGKAPDSMAAVRAAKGKGKAKAAPQAKAKSKDDKLSRLLAMLEAED